MNPSTFKTELDTKKRCFRFCLFPCHMCSERLQYVLKFWNIFISTFLFRSFSLVKHSFSDLLINNLLFLVCTYQLLNSLIWQSSVLLYSNCRTPQHNRRRASCTVLRTQFSIDREMRRINWMSCRGIPHAVLYQWHHECYFVLRLFQASSTCSRVFSKTEIQFPPYLRKTASTRSVFESYVRKSEPWTWAWRHRIWKLPFSPVHTSTMNLRFQTSPPWPAVFSAHGNTGYVWTVAVFGEKSLRFSKYPATCGQGFNLPSPRTREQDCFVSYVDLFTPGTKASFPWRWTGSSINNNFSSWLHRCSTHVVGLCSTLVAKGPKMANWCVPRAWP